MVFSFDNLIGLYSFLALIPLIIIYLIKPKPNTLKVPSLMFLMKRINTSTSQSLFRYFQRDILFYIQLLILLLLCFSIAQPILTLNRDVFSSNIVFIIDVSASAKVTETNGQTRLDIAKNKIKDLETSKNSLILLKSYPVVALQDVSSRELNNYLDRLEATDDTSDVASAITLASDLLITNKGRVVVVSDLIESKGIGANVAKNVLNSRGIPVDFYDTKSTNRSNVGIVDMVINGETANLYVKNYNTDIKKISLKVNNDTNILNIKSNSVEPFVFNVKGKITNVEILDKDDFNVDNKVTILRPYSDKIKVLLISNNPSKYLKAVLKSIDGVELTIAEPPVIPKGDFDLYVINNVDKDKLVVDTFGAIKRDLSDNGKAVIVLSQNNIEKINFEGLVPFTFGNLVNGGNAVVDQTNRFTKDIDFASVNKIYNISNFGDEIVSANNISVISLFNLGRGRIVYYGILDDKSDFKITPSYPVFWSNLVYYLVGRDDLNDVNLKTGFLYTDGNESKTLDKMGVYTVNDKTISVNLLNEKESDINYVGDNINSTVNHKLETVKTKVDYDLDILISILAILLVLFEFIYIKFRGEI